MPVIDQNTIAATLAALLAVLACFERPLHHAMHAWPGAGCCSGGEHAACHEHADGSHHQGCSHSEGVDESQTDSGESAPAEHDPDQCIVCRHLALPLLAELPQTLETAAGLVGACPPAESSSCVSRVVTLVPIRGPPARHDHSC